MECLDVVAGLRVMILVMLVCSMNTVLLSFIFIFFGGLSVVLLFFVGIEARVMSAKTFTNVMIIIQIFLLLAFILYCAGIVASIISRMMDAIVTWVLASIGTGIVGVTTI